MPSRSTLESLDDPDIHAEPEQAGQGAARGRMTGTDPERTASWAEADARDAAADSASSVCTTRGAWERLPGADAEVNREVALKQMKEDIAADPQSRARFVFEAEITGNLEHPGIVPVYGKGEYADGRPYYAMRFIRGETLKAAVDRFHKDRALEVGPGRSRSASFRSCCGGSWSSARRWRMPTAGASFTAT